MARSPGHGGRGEDPLRGPPGAVRAGAGRQYHTIYHYYYRCIIMIIVCLLLLSLLLLLLLVVVVVL